MTKRMLIDATHAEETRVVVLDGTRLEDFDVETSAKRQLKGNIYLAKVVRVEPSLQAAFVEYGGNRHGFLAFGEIHPDYYQIPVADRQRLIEQEAEEARREEEEEDRAAAADGSEPVAASEPPEAAVDEIRSRSSARRRNWTRCRSNFRRHSRRISPARRSRHRSRLGNPSPRSNWPRRKRPRHRERSRPPSRRWNARPTRSPKTTMRQCSHPTRIPSTRRRRPWAARATAPRSRASAASRRATCATTRSRR